MKKTFSIIALVAILTVLLSSCEGNKYPPSTEEVRLEQIRLDHESIENDKRRSHELEMEKVRAEAEAKIPESVRLQAEKNKETTVGEGISEGIGWATLGAV